MANVEFGMGKTFLILVIVLGCFVVLWPKIIYPILVASFSKRGDTYNHDGCCDVIFDTDINAIKIMNDLCGSILSREAEINPKLAQSFQQGKISKEIINTCRTEVMNMCGIDIAEFLSKKEKLGHSYKQMLDEIRSFNISICLRQNFGVNPALLGAPRRMRIWGPSTSRHLRQERPLHLHPEMIHPALREKGRAIPHSHMSVDEKRRRSIPMPGVRPPMGGPGHVVPPPKTGGTMSIIMPIYTALIVCFFLYSVLKIFMGKPKSDMKDFHSDPEFRRVVYSEDYSNGCPARTNDDGLRSGKETLRKRRSPGEPTRLDWKQRDTRDDEIDHLRKRLQETEKAMERIVAQMETVPTELLSQTQLTLRSSLSKELYQQKGLTADSPPLKSKKSLEESSPAEKQPVVQLKEQVQVLKEAKNGQVDIHRDFLNESEADDAKPKVKVVGLELMAECEGGQKWSRPATPNLGVGGSSRPTTPVPPTFSPEPQNIFLEGALPQQSQLLVTDSKTQTLTLPEGSEPETPVILSSKMTLSLISLDAALPEESQQQERAQNQVEVKSETDDNLENADSTLFDADSEIIDETGPEVGSTSIPELEGVDSSAVSKEINELSEEEISPNYTTATSERAEAGLLAESEDTGADVSNLDGLDLIEDQEDLQNEETHLCNGTSRGAAQESDE